NIEKPIYIDREVEKIVEKPVYIEKIIEKPVYIQKNTTNFSNDEDIDANKFSNATLNTEIFNPINNKTSVKKEKINYINTFNQIYTNQQDLTQEIKEDALVEEEDDDYKIINFSDLKHDLQKDGVNLKPYIKKNTTDFYVNNFYYINKILRNTALIMFIALVIEFVCAWGCVHNDYKIWTLAITVAVCALMPISFLIKFLINPTKRKRANFNVKQSLLNSLILIINCIVVILLLGFFVFNANISDFSTMIVPVLMPILFLFNIPASIIVFALLYNTRKYHMV
ncbi:MAG: hypothetical protein RR374_06310, partial [Clostridia bacterium]